MVQEGIRQNQGARLHVCMRSMRPNGATAGATLVRLIEKLLATRQRQEGIFQVRPR